MYSTSGISKIQARCHTSRNTKNECRKIQNNIIYDSNGTKGNGVNPSDEEMKSMYGELRKIYDEASANQSTSFYSITAAGGPTANTQSADSCSAAAVAADFATNKAVVKNQAYTTTNAAFLRTVG